MNPRQFLLFFFFLCAFQLPAASFASTLKPEDAGKLKSIFETLLAYQKDATRPGGSKFEYDGNVMVEEAGSYFAVTLPHARIVYPDGSKLDIGMVSINASPHTQDGQWKMAVAIPTPIILLDPQQKQATRINIGAQKAVGIWDENLENFAKLDGQYNNVTIENPSTGFKAALPETRIIYDFTKDAAGQWSGPGTVSIKNITADIPGQGNFKIADTKADFAVNQYDPAVLKQYRQFLTTFLKDTQAQAQNGATPSPDQTTALADKLSDLLLNSSDAFKGDYSLSGLEITRPASGTTPSQTLKISKAFFGMGASGMKSGNASVGIRFGFNDFFSNPVPSGYEGVLPSASNIDIALANVPLKQLAEVTKNTIQGSLAQPEMAQLAGFSLLMKAPALLSQAGTYMDIKDNFIGNDQYRFYMNGKAKADISAVNNITADVQGGFKGLDELLSKINKIAADPKHPAAESAKGLSGTLETLKTYGKKAPPEPDGKSAYTYHFVMDPKGQILLNNKPLGLETPPPQ